VALAAPNLSASSAYARAPLGALSAKGKRTMSIGDRLLYAVSARGAMSWVSVKRAFDCLHEAAICTMKNSGGIVGGMRSAC
jgi:hypothetical protein